uniref:Cathepsin O n=1 Tax=Tigriopus japonicus TaxID=158387 RepID=A0A0H4KD91_TIGJA|nr:cathepsin O [Tigriopus japonicus]
MKVFIALAFFVALASAATFQEEGFLSREFQLFEAKFGKKYASIGERQSRYNIFKQNVAKIQQHNLSGKSWTESITQFADMTHEEFVSQRLNGYVNMKKEGVSAAKTQQHIDISALPESVDWREKGAVTDVKDQGSCGSCWAFASVESIESYVAINNGTLMELSAQQITSCTPNELQCGGTGGCQGSIPQLGWTFVQLFGLVSEADWPYQSGSNGATGDCNDSSDMNKAVTVRGYELLPRNDYNAILNHLATVGPLAVAVDASFWGFYGGGVFDGCPYDSNIAINHAVQMVGYGTDPDEGDYWIVRNSWGPSWGEDGYIRLKRESTPQCGTDSTPLTGTACVNDGNDEQYVCGTCAVLFDVLYPIGAQAL